MYVYIYIYIYIYTNKLIIIIIMIIMIIASGGERPQRASEHRLGPLGDPLLEARVPLHRRDDRLASRARETIFH